MTSHEGLPKLQDTVEVDETLVGPRAKPKAPVVALIERLSRGARIKNTSSPGELKSLVAGGLAELVKRTENIFYFLILHRHFAALAVVWELRVSGMLML